MGQALGNFFCSESCPTQLNDMSGIELIYGVTSSVPKVLTNTFPGEFSHSVEKWAFGATTLRGKLQLRLGRAEQIPNPTRRQPF